MGSNPLNSKPLRGKLKTGSVRVTRSLVAPHLLTVHWISRLLCGSERKGNKASWVSPKRHTHVVGSLAASTRVAIDLSMDSRNWSVGVLAGDVNWLEQARMRRLAAGIKQLAGAIGRE